MSESTVPPKTGSNNPFFVKRRNRATQPERELWDSLDQIEDPHLPLSLVEMGMIYDVRFDDGNAIVDMTFPCLGCPAYDMILEDIEHGVGAHERVENVEIELVWEPVWAKDMLTPDVQNKLKNAGIGL